MKKKWPNTEDASKIEIKGTIKLCMACGKPDCQFSILSQDTEEDENV